MVRTDERAFADFVHDLDINGLSGRMAYVPATYRKTRDILFVYGQRSTLEQWQPIIMLLSRYGNVTAPDLPGFGGMDSFFKIGRRPTIDTYADYLAALVKLRYRRRKSVLIVAVGYGMVAATRMLARYPSIRNRTTGIISLGGWVRYDDLGFSPGKRSWRKFVYAIAGSFLGAATVRLLGCNSWMLPKIIKALGQDSGSAASASTAARVAAETDLWRQNDIRTYAYTTRELLQFDNCGRQLHVAFWHVPIGIRLQAARQQTEQRLRVAFSNVEVLPACTAVPLVIDQRTVKTLASPRLRRILAHPTPPLS